MKEVFEQYGSVWIAALIAGVIISLLFYGVWNGKIGLGEVSGEFLTAGGKNQLKQNDNLAYREMRERKPPEIQLRLSGIHEAQSVSIQEMFDARDAEGNPLELQVLQVKKDGVEEAAFHPVENGLYEVWLEAKDTLGFTTQKTVWIPIQLM